MPLSRPIVTPERLLALEVFEGVDWPFALKHPVGHELWDLAGQAFNFNDDSLVTTEDLEALLDRYATFAEQLDRHLASR
jgi:hypothetical protein